MARKLRNASTFVPLTPKLPSPRPSGKLTEAELGIELFDLRRLLRIERARHAKLEGALGRYVELLEKIVGAQREAFELLHAPLVVNPLDLKGGR